MKNLSQNQFYEVMTIVQNRLTTHNDFLYREYGFSSKLEGKLEELKNEIKKDLQSLVHLND